MPVTADLILSNLDGRTGTPIAKVPALGAVPREEHPLPVRGGWSLRGIRIKDAERSEYGFVYRGHLRAPNPAGGPRALAARANELRGLRISDF